MEKFLYYNELYLIYKDLLNESNRDIFNLYYGENLSMQEIADLKSVTKSRIGAIIKNVQEKLNNYENILKLYEKKKILNEIMNIDDINKIKEEINKVIEGE